MRFIDFLEKHGPSVKEFAEMRTHNRPGMVQAAYSLYISGIRGRTITTGEMLAVIAGFDLATEVMVYRSMARDARAAAEKDDNDETARRQRAVVQPHRSD